MRKKLCIFLLLTILVGLFAGMSAYAVETEENPTEEIEIYLDGELLETCEGTLINETTYVPLRAVCDALGGGDVAVGWNGETRTATVTAEGLSLEVPVHGDYMVANGRYLYTEHQVQLVNDLTMVPVRELIKVFNASLVWDAEETAVYITSGEGYIQSGDSYYDADDLLWLSRIIYCEAGSESLEGMIAVGNVVLNRVADPRFPDTIYDVIFQQGQFGPVSYGSIYCTPPAEAVVAAKLALEGYNVAENALYFFNPYIAEDSWLVNNCTFVMNIGNHAFYA